MPSIRAPGSTPITGSDSRQLHTGSGPGNVQQTIGELEAQGYNVIVNRIGSTPLGQATVVAVRPGQTYSRTDSPITSVGNKTVYVDVK
jgi:hypothetical protein